MRFVAYGAKSGLDFTEVGRKFRGDLVRSTAKHVGDTNMYFIREPRQFHTCMITERVLLHAKACVSVTTKSEDRKILFNVLLNAFCRKVVLDHKNLKNDTLLALALLGVKGHSLVHLNCLVFKMQN
jgi:hypothetical protein